MVPSISWKKGNIWVILIFKVMKKGETVISTGKLKTFWKQLHLSFFSFSLVTYWFPPVRSPNAMAWRRRYSYVYVYSIYIYIFMLWKIFFDVCSHCLNNTVIFIGDLTVFRYVKVIIVSKFGYKYVWYLFYSSCRS